MHGVVSAVEPEAVDVAAEVLKAGGNAMDAAVACALVQGVVDPPMSGIGGWGTMQVLDPATKRHRCYDFYATAPMAARPDQWSAKLQGQARDGWGFIVEDHVNEIGYQAIATPGTVAGLALAHSRHGSMPWRDLCQPAASIAREGFPVRPNLIDFLLGEGSQGRAAPRDKMRFSRTGRDLYYRPDGTPKQIGTVVRNPDMADTLEMLARDGAETFYRGDLARQMADDIQENGGLLTYEDLTAYRVVEYEPVIGSYRGLSVATNQPPGGGYVLLLMLRMLQEFDLTGLAHNGAEHIRILAEVMKFATAAKDRYLGDPEFIEIPHRMFTGDEDALAAVAGMKAGRRFEVERLAKQESKDTTHLSIMDETGMAVSMTHSLGMVSGAVTEGLGFMYNGAMGVFDPRPGHAGSIAPGKRRYTSACPAIVLRADKPLIVTGAPGGAHIATSVLQSLSNTIDFGMGLDQAVAAPRVSVTSNTIDICNRIPRSVQLELEANYQVSRSARSFTFAKVHAVGELTPGKWTGGADPGGDGMVLAV